MKEENLLDRITVNPEVMVGKPTIRDLRITVEQILKALAGGVTAEELLEDYPELEKEDIQAVKNPHAPWGATKHENGKSIFVVSY